MTKAELLDKIRRDFEVALNEKYESFSISIDRNGSELTLNISGASEGYKAFRSTHSVKLEEGQK